MALDLGHALVRACHRSRCTAKRILVQQSAAPQHTPGPASRSQLASSLHTCHQSTPKWGLCHPGPARTPPSATLILTAGSRGTPPWAHSPRRPAPMCRHQPPHPTPACSWCARASLLGCPRLAASQSRTHPAHLDPAPTSPAIPASASAPTARALQVARPLARGHQCTPAMRKSQLCLVRLTITLSARRWVRRRHHAMRSRSRRAAILWRGCPTQ